MENSDMESILLKTLISKTTLHDLELDFLVENLRPIYMYVNQGSSYREITLPDQTSPCSGLEGEVNV